ncbi:MAG TPA: ACT domain-containing protein [Thermoanaerobaculaceae bacterium]|nr:ACT domain-containing protein [Thermoanaerobaculaceae bacterium]
MEPLQEPVVGVRLWPQVYAIARLDTVPEGLPSHTVGGPPVAVIVGHGEVSVLAPEDVIGDLALPGDEVFRGWRALTLEAVFPLGTVGVLATVSGALAEVGVPVMVFSSHDTDHFLVPAASLGRALAALNQASLGRFLRAPGR